MELDFETHNLAVGYDGRVLIHDINLALEKGKILTLIGPNGAGKSTILKSITRQLATLGGTVKMAGEDITTWAPKKMAQKTAVVLTDRVRPELVTCREIVAMGRYPYTNLFGKLTPQDQAAVQEALGLVHALDLGDREFTTLSDGQRQRILLARAICQEPEILILDEPTAYLDIRHKVELLDILEQMAREKQMTVILSLHEIDLATKLSDYLLCVKGDTIAAFGPPEQVLEQHSMESLYDMEKGSYNPLFGSVELKKPEGIPRVFVVAGAGRGIACYRALQKRSIPFATGILQENDLDYPVAAALSQQVVAVPAFHPLDEEAFRQAASLLLSCQAVVDAGAPVGPWNQRNQELLALARERQIPLYGPEGRNVGGK